MITAATAKGYVGFRLYARGVGRKGIQLLVPAGVDAFTVAFVVAISAALTVTVVAATIVASRATFSVTSPGASIVALLVVYKAAATASNLCVGEALLLISVNVVSVVVGA